MHLIFMARVVLLSLVCASEHRSRLFVRCCVCLCACVPMRVCLSCFIFSVSCTHRSNIQSSEAMIQIAAYSWFETGRARVGCARSDTQWMPCSTWAARSGAGTNNRVLTLSLRESSPSGIYSSGSQKRGEKAKNWSRWHKWLNDKHKKSTGTQGNV